jgi:hypothetical protein
MPFFNNFLNKIISNPTLSNVFFLIAEALSILIVASLLYFQGKKENKEKNIMA